MRRKRQFTQSMMKKRIEYDEFKERLEKAGRILIISNLNKDCKEIFEMYKSRDIVEKHFDTVKNMLKADILYLRDEYSVFSHIFAAYLSLYGYCKIENMLRERSLFDKISPMDVLERFSSVFIIGDENRKIIT